jgi:hypothetical protein
MAIFMKLQYKNKNNKAEIWLNNNITVMHCSIPTLNTAGLFSRWWYTEAKILGIFRNINTIPSLRRIIYKLI